MYPFIHIGPLTLGTYGIMVATGLICAFFVIRADLRRRGYGADAENIIGTTGLLPIPGHCSLAPWASPGLAR
jgi:prolipoprotein diacylglyceryltransferase